MHLEGFQGVINLLVVEAIKVYLRHTLRTMRRFSLCAHLRAFSSKKNIKKESYISVTL